MSPIDEHPVVFFELLETLGSERASPTERLVRYRVYPEARAALESLWPAARLGVIASDPEIRRDRLEEVLAAQELSGLLDPALLIAPGAHRNPFQVALQATGLAAGSGRVVYVGLDATLRTQARREGMLVAPHPALTRAVLSGEALRYVRLSVAESPALAQLPVVPLIPTREAEPRLYAIAAESALEALDAEILAADVGTTSLYVIQVSTDEENMDGSIREFLERLRANLPLVHKSPLGWMVAVPGELTGVGLLRVLHPPNAGHGHSYLLLPSLSLLRDREPLQLPETRPLSPDEKRVFSGIEEGRLRQLCRPWLEIQPRRRPPRFEPQPTGPALEPPKRSGGPDSEI